MILFPWSDWLEIRTVFIFFQERPFLYLILSLVVITFIARVVFDVFTPYSLKTELFERQNRAVGLSFAGYITGAGVIIQGVLQSDEIFAGLPLNIAGWKLLLWDVVDTLSWSFLGIFLLGVAWWINDKLILKRLNNQKELIQNQNDAVSFVEMGSYLGSAFIIRGSLTGEGGSFPAELVGTFLFFLLGQVLFLLFSMVYQRLTSYDVYEEISGKNGAAGLSLGANITAFGWAVGLYSATHDSLAGLAVWSGLFMLIWIGIRFLVDKVLLPWDSLDKEISKDRNWNAALAESAVMLVSSVWLSTLFL